MAWPSGREGRCTTRIGSWRASAAWSFSSRPPSVPDSLVMIPVMCQSWRRATLRAVENGPTMARVRDAGMPAFFAASKEEASGMTRQNHSISGAALVKRARSREPVVRRIRLPSRGMRGRASSADFADRALFGMGIGGRSQRMRGMFVMLEIRWSWDWMRVAKGCVASTMTLGAKRLRSSVRALSPIAPGKGLMRGATFRAWSAPVWVAVETVTGTPSSEMAFAMRFPSRVPVKTHTPPGGGRGGAALGVWFFHPR